MKILPRIMLLLACIMPLGADDLPVVTLDEAIAAASENNLTLKQAAISANQRIRNANNYVKDYLPTFGISVIADTGVSFPRFRYIFRGAVAAVGKNQFCLREQLAHPADAVAGRIVIVVESEYLGDVF